MRDYVVTTLQGRILTLAKTQHLPYTVCSKRQEYEPTVLILLTGIDSYLR